MHHPYDTTRTERLICWLGVALCVGILIAGARLAYIMVRFGEHLACAQQVTP